MSERPAASLNSLDQQIAYYRARANEYDEWFLRQGRYDRGEESNQAWFTEVAEVQASLDAFAPRGEVLELACGTGLWTERLLRHTSRVTAIDASPEMLKLNLARNGAGKVEAIQANLFEWEPDRQHDIVFFSFWLSHVPTNQLAPFWEKIDRALKPDGRIFFVDSLQTLDSMAKNHAPPDVSNGVSRRKLNNGREYDVVKIFHEPKQLEARLTGYGWNVTVKSTNRFFLHGAASLKRASIA